MIELITSSPFSGESRIPILFIGKKGETEGIELLLSAAGSSQPLALPALAGLAALGAPFFG